MRTMIELRVSGGTLKTGERAITWGCFSLLFFFFIPKVNRIAFESNLKAKQNKTKNLCPDFKSRTVTRCMVSNGYCPFSQKQLIKTNWRLCGFYRIRRLERCSPLLTSASEWPRPLDMRSYGVKSFEIKFEACIIALPVSHHLPMCLELRWPGTESGRRVHILCNRKETHRLNWASVCLYVWTQERVNIWRRLQNITHIWLKSKTWRRPQIKWLLTCQFLKQQ